MLRVLATWDPQSLPSPHDARTIEEDADLGLLPDTDAREWFAGAWDPRADFSPDASNELDWARETAAGIEVCRHPEAALRDSPRLWDVVAMWRSGVEREISRADYAALSNFEIECWLTMAAAHSRETERRIKRARETQDE